MTVCNDFLRRVVQQDLVRDLAYAIDITNSLDVATLAERISSDANIEREKTRIHRLLRSPLPWSRDLEQVLVREAKTWDVERLEVGSRDVPRLGLTICALTANRVPIALAAPQLGGDLTRVYTRFMKLSRQRFSRQPTHNISGANLKPLIEFFSNIETGDQTTIARLATLAAFTLFARQEYQQRIAEEKRMAQRKPRAKPKRTDTKETIEILTPKKAKEYLATMGTNRKIIKRKLRQYIEDMKSGNWGYTADPIRFNTKGELFDGQHRLTACIEANTPFETKVVRNLDPDVAYLVDTGAARTPAHALEIAGYQYASQASAAAKLIWGMERLEAGETEGRRISNNVIPRHALMEFMAENEEEIMKACKAITGRSRDFNFIMRPPALFIALRFRFGQANELRAKEFFEHLGTGANLDVDSPIYKLIKKLTRELGVKPGQPRRPLEWKGAITIKAWNAWLRGEKLDRLQFGADEAWPKIYAKMMPQRRKRKK